MKLLRFFAVLGLVALLGGCRPFSVKTLEGDYQGLFTIRSQDKIDEFEVKAKVKFEEKRRSKITVSSESQNFEIEVIQTGPHKALLKSAIFKNDILLNKVRQHCFLSFEDANQKEKDTAQICFENSKRDTPVLSLDVSFDSGAQKLGLILSTDDSFSLPASETPKSYTLDELRLLVQSKSFDSRIELEKLKTARLIAENSAANLAPHVSANFALGFIGTTFNPLSLIRSIGSLAPFLFPTNWFKAIEKSDLARAEEQAQIILRADTVNTVESLTYNYLRDFALLKEMSAHEQRIIDFQKKVAGRVEARLMPKEANWKLQAQLDVIRQSKIAAEKALHEDLRAIALASGFNSPNAIADITADTESLFTSAISQSIGPSDLFEKAAVLRSPELIQIDYLVKAARMQKQERIWNWLDPAADSAGAIGAGLPAYIQIGSSNYRMVQVQREQLIAKLRNRALSAYDELDTSLRTLGLISDIREQQSNSLALLTRQFNEGDAVDLLTLLTTLQDRFAAEVNYINARFGTLVSFAKRERMLMMGKYSNQPTLRHSQ